MMKKRLIFGVHLTDRLKEASQVQALLTEYGCHIKTRLGLHNVDKTYCSSAGLLLLEMFGEEAPCQELARKLAAIAALEVKQMEFPCD